MEVIELETLYFEEPEYCQIEIDREKWDIDCTLALHNGSSIVGIAPENASLHMSKERTGRATPDLLANTDSLLVVSEKIKKLFQTYIKEEAEYLPVTIINHRNRAEKNSFYIINPLGTYDVFSSKAKIDYDEEGEIASIDKVIMSEEKLEDVPELFRITGQSWKYYLKSGPLLDALDEIKLKNITGNSIKVVA